MSRLAESTPLVLVTNDDGIGSDGLFALARALEHRGARVLVAAPAINMSGASAAMGPIAERVPITRTTVDGISSPCFAVQAPPGMIVIAALNGGFGDIPTAVASGVNNGVNLGRAILHSGTVGAALTAQNLGLPAVAVSLQGGTSWELAAEAGVNALDDVLTRDPPIVANVNVPTGVTPATGTVVTQLARFGSVTSAIEGDELQFQVVIDADALGEEGTDGAALRDGQISVTYLTGSFGPAESHLDVSVRTVPAP